MKYSNRSLFGTLLFFSGFGVLFLFSACQNKTTVEPREIPDELVPLAVGNEWAYELSYFINGQPNGLVDTFTVRIVADTTLIYEGQEHFVTIRDLLHNPSNTVEEEKWFEWNGPEGLYNMGGFSDTDTLVTKFLELQYPVNVGDSWEVPRLVYHTGFREFVFTDTLTYTCVAKDSLFETSLGSFNSIVFHYQLEAQEEDALGFTDFYLYYTHGIGLVGLEEKYNVFLIERLSLFEYKIQ